jgi:hypothetical protein
MSISTCCPISDATARLVWQIGQLCFLQSFGERSLYASPGGQSYRTSPEMRDARTPRIQYSSPLRYFSWLQLPSISMRREVSARPEAPVTPLLHEPSLPPGNREGTLSFPNVDKLVSQFVRICLPTETVPCYFPFLAFLRDSPKAKCRARKDKTPSKRQGPPGKATSTSFEDGCF